MRKTPSVETYKLLYVRSGNECAFPECTHPIFNDDGLYIAELCHIKAANKGGQRYDENQTDDERKALENLLFLCHRHHKETDDVKKFTVDTLVKMKQDHESQFTEQGKQLTQKMLQQIENEAEFFWNSQSNRSFEFEDLKIIGEFNKDIFEIYNDVENYINSVQELCETLAESDENNVLNKDLEKIFQLCNLDYSKVEQIEYLENPFINRNWEIHNLAMRNYHSKIILSLNQLKLKIIELLINNEPKDEELKALLSRERAKFNELYPSLYYAD